MYKPARNLTKSDLDIEEKKIEEEFNFSYEKKIGVQDKQCQQKYEKSDPKKFELCLDRLQEMNRLEFIALYHNQKVAKDNLHSCKEIIGNSSEAKNICFNLYLQDIQFNMNNALVYANN